MADVPEVSTGNPAVDWGANSVIDMFSGKKKDSGNNDKKKKDYPNFFDDPIGAVTSFPSRFLNDTMEGIMNVIPMILIGIALIIFIIWLVKKIFFTQKLKQSKKWYNQFGPIKAMEQSQQLADNLTNDPKFLGTTIGTATGNPAVALGV
jgi:hypothetical protein